MVENEVIIITKNGKDVAKLVPVKKSNKTEFLYGLLKNYKDKIERKGSLNIFRKVPRAIIMEFKMSEGDPEKDAQKALDQIESRKYDADLRDRGIDNIVKVGIALRGKTCSCRVV